MADQACRACKRQKRRCDKGLPECSLCRRTGRLCQYDGAPDPAPTASDFAVLTARLEELEDRLAAASSATGSSAAAATLPATPARHHHHPVTVRSSSGHQSSIYPASPLQLGYSAHGQSEDSEAAPAAGSDFALAALFLDLDCFVWSRLRLPPPDVAIPLVRCDPCECNRYPCFDRALYVQSCAVCFVCG